MKLLIEVPFALKTPEPENFMYPYLVTAGTSFTCDEDLLNVQNYPRRSARATRATGTGSDPPRNHPRSDGGGSTDDPVKSVEYACQQDVYCVNITCSIDQIRSDIVGLQLVSYIWERSFREQIIVSTSVRAWVGNEDPGADLLPSSRTGPIKIPLRFIADEKIAKPVSIWVLIGSILGGLCFLGLVVVVLHKLGFFNRKRPPKAEFYSNEPTVIEVVDDSYPGTDGVEPHHDSEEEEEGQFTFSNPLYDQN